jgi:VWFA-related protein
VDKRILAFVLVFFVLALPFAASTPASAQQENWNLSINLVSPLEQPDGMLLKVYFTIFEGHSGAPVMDAQPTGGQIAILNTNYTADAVIKKPDIPIYITLVMDASGSMGGAADALKKAAKQSLNNIPDNSYFSVVQFNESINLLQDFTQNIPAVAYAIDQYQVGRNKGTCLYDAAYTAIESMSKLPAARRAVILFTDGKDETINGSVCSKHTYQELVDLAMKGQVPLNTIGLSAKGADINAVELQSMASSTGGFSSIAAQADLPAAFGRIMDSLKAQWMAEATIYPKQGTNNGVLTVMVQDNQTLNSAFTVESSKEYPGPPSPVTVRLDGLELNAAKQAYEVQLSLTSPQLAKYVKIEVWDKQGGSKVGEYVFNDPVVSNSFEVPTESLTIDHDYELRLSAVSKQDGTAFALGRDDQGNPTTQLIHDFKFDPSTAYPNLSVKSVVENNGDLVLAVALTSPELVGGFSGWLVNEDTNTQVPNSNFTSAPLSGTSGNITIPMKANRIASGKYTVVTQVLAKNNNVFSTTTYEGVTYTAPSLFQRLGVALIAAPIFLVGVLVIILGVVAFLMYSNSRQKSMTGTPVLQGRLGGGLGTAGKAGGSNLPVSDNEPIPVRRGAAVVAASQPPVATPASSRPPVTPMPVQAPPSNATMVGGASVSGNETMISSAPAIARPILTVIRAPAGALSQPQVMVDSLPFVIGRTEGRLVINEGNVSRRHAQITYDDARQAYVLTDLQSSNGTKLNEQRLTPGVPVLLNNGAVIGLGPNVTLRFSMS